MPLNSWSQVLVTELVLDGPIESARDACPLGLLRISGLEVFCLLLQYLDFCPSPLPNLLRGQPPLLYCFNEFLAECVMFGWHPRFVLLQAIDGRLSLRLVQGRVFNQPVRTRSTGDLRPLEHRQITSIMTRQCYL